MRLQSVTPLVAALGYVAALGTTAEAQVTVEQILRYKPVQKDVEIETPQQSELGDCRIDVERGDETSGWAVFGPQGQLLRRFVDTDGDNVVDHWRYYLNGLEVYRDIDTDADNEVNESRWLNTAGTRWGIDQDQDGRIDLWKRISAEEASREAIRAMAAGDADALSTLLVTGADLQLLGVSDASKGKILEAVRGPEAKLRAALRGSATLQSTTKWLRFDSSMLMPNLVPAESGLSDRDLLVYENVMAIVETGGETGFVQIGEMVKVGDVWKLTRIPQPLDSDSPQITEGGVLLQNALASTAGIPGGVNPSPEFLETVNALQTLDENAPAPDSEKAQLVAYNTRRADLLEKLAGMAGTAEERQQWVQQRIDGIAAATQMDAYPNGVRVLQQIESEIRRQNAESPLIPYVTYRRMTAEYNLQMQQADAEGRAEVQTSWLGTLEKFITDYPRSEDSADAMLQLAMAHEFNGEVDEAKNWYSRLSQSHPEAPAATIGNGALRRLNLEGKPLTLSGPGLNGGSIDLAQYRGKVVAVLFWATWCRPCTEELPQFKELYETHHRQGFEIIGVNVDMPNAPIQDYIRQYQVPWPHIHEQGGLQSNIAQQYGVITLPTMFLIDKRGNVVNPAATLEDFKRQVPELLGQ